MITTGEIAAALTGAWRLAQQDRQGLAYFDASAAGAIKSFNAALIVLPGHALVYALAHVAAPETPAWRVGAVGLIVYVIGWVAYPLAMAGICELIDRPRRYLSFVVANNWAAVLQAAIMVPAALLRLLFGGVAPALVYLAALAAALAYAWFVARAALDVDRLTAAGLVLLSFLLDLLISGFGDALLFGA